MKTHRLPRFELTANGKTTGWRDPGVRVDPVEYVKLLRRFALRNAAKATGERQAALYYVAAKMHRKYRYLKRYERKGQRIK